MRISEHPFAPVFQQFAFRTINLYWNFAAVEGPDVSVRRNRDAGHRSPIASRRLFRWPGGIDLVAYRVIDARIRNGMLRLSERCRAIQKRQSESPSQQHLSAVQHRALQ